jgi:hypothetical protein
VCDGGSNCTVNCLAGATCTLDCSNAGSTCNCTGPGTCQ